MWGGDGGGSFSKHADLTVKISSAQKINFLVWISHAVKKVTSLNFFLGGGVRGCPARFFVSDLFL